MGSAAATDEGAARQRWFISSQSRRALADLAPAVLGFALARSAFLAASYGSYRGTDAGPVSYTHLDVYKRQAPCSTPVAAAASAA